MQFSWSDLPHELAVPLLNGSVGKEHLIGLAETAMKLGTMEQRTKSGFGAVGLEMARAALECDMLDGSFVGQMASMHESRPFLPVSCYKVARIVAMSSRPPEDSSELNLRLAQRDFEELSKYLKQMRRKDPGNLFWLRIAMLTGFTNGKTEWMLGWIDLFNNLPKPMADAMRADVFFSAGEWRQAMDLYARAASALPVLLWRERLAEVCARLGDMDKAMEEWEAVLAERPWHTNLILRRSDALGGLDRPGVLPEGRGAVLLYTWNKAEPLDLTLSCIAESNLGDAAVIVLDNGSSDATPAVLEKYAAVFGERFQRLAMPCNIGAPAARNWLLTLPETKACDWVAFLDDDALVPPDWLGLLGRTMLSNPDHPVYGCRVVDYATPMFIQCADLHLEKGAQRGSMQGGQNGLEPGHIRNFELSGLHHQVLDFGQFSYARPCVSVTGCCHLFRRAALDEAGHFDLRFSPSQYDDLEHDIRHALKNGLPFYQGHLRVRHMKRSGTAAWTDRSQLMSSWANLFKINTNYSS